jgi:multiple sugar transport system ATP-binding protein
MELLGDATMVTVKIKDKLVSVKADKNFRAKIGDEINFSIPSQICHLFDAKTGARLSG